MGYHDNNRPRPIISRKYIKVIELVGESVHDLEPGQRVVDSRIIHDVVEVKQPNGIGSPNSRSHTPDYKTVIVLECVEYKDDLKQ